MSKGPSSQDLVREIARIQQVFVDRARDRAALERDSMLNPGNVKLVQECWSYAVRLIQSGPKKSAPACRILDVGCGKWRSHWLAS